MRATVFALLGARDADTSQYLSQFAHEFDDAGRPEVLASRSAVNRP